MFALLVLSACHRKEAPRPTHEVQVAAPSPPAPKPHPQSYQGALANFAKGQMWECTDVVVTIDPPEDAGAGWKPNGDPLEKIFGKEVMRLPKPCAKQFHDRAALASCTVSNAVEGMRVKATSSYYNYEDVGLGDEHMKDCLQAGGSWNSLPSDSREWRRANLSYASRSLKNATDKL